MISRLPVLAAAFALAAFSFATALPCAKGIIVQLDAADLVKEKLPGLLEKVKASRAQEVQLAWCCFYADGEKRTNELARLGMAIRFFEGAGYPVTVWTSTLDYGAIADPDYLRRFPGHRPLRSFSYGSLNNGAFNGYEEAVCPTDIRHRAAIEENIRDFIRAGAKTILFDDELVLANRPGVGCACEEHLRRAARRLGRASLAAEEVKRSYCGAPNEVRNAFLAVEGESLMDFAKAMRAAADSVEPKTALGLCTSISHYDLDGIDLREMVRLLAAPGQQPLLRLGGATYWPREWGRPSYVGQDLGGVFEFLKAQLARLDGCGFRLFDENDTFPRDPRVVPPGMCELYDKFVVAQGALLRNKYILRRNFARKCDMDSAYLKAHVDGLRHDAEIVRAFAGTKEIGFRIFVPEHAFRDASLPDEFLGNRELISFFTQPMAGILVAASGFPTNYDRADAPTVVFGTGAESVPEELLANGVVTDRDGAAILERRGFRLGEKAARHGEWTIRRGALRVAVCDRSWFALDYGHKGAGKFPGREVWRELTGREPEVYATGGSGVYVYARQAREGGVSVFVANVVEGDTGDFELVLRGRRIPMSLPAWGWKVVQEAGKARAETGADRAEARWVSPRGRGGAHDDVQPPHLRPRGRLAVRGGGEDLRAP